jgi:hypothetical protein
MTKDQMSERKPVIEVIEPMMVEVWRRMTPQQRLSKAFDMWKSARIIVSGSVRCQYPEWTKADVDRETARRLSHGATEHVLR